MKKMWMSLLLVILLLTSLAYAEESHCGNIESNEVCLTDPTNLLYESVEEACATIGGTCDLVAYTYGEEWQTDIPCEDYSATELFLQYIYFIQDPPQAPMKVTCDIDCSVEENCIYEDCLKSNDCHEQECNEDTGNVVVWSYNLPNELNAYNQGSKTEAISCCQKDSCAYGDNKCQIYNTLNSDQGYLCSENNNWLVCNSETPDLIGTKSLSEDFYCTETGWIPVETNCSDGKSEGGYSQLTDCADPTCNGEIGAAYGQNGCLLEGGCVCQQGEELICDDGFDNWQEGMAVHTPPKIVTPEKTGGDLPGLIEYCKDGKDTDYDNLIDCADPDCNNKECLQDDASGFCEEVLISPDPDTIYAHDILNVYSFSWETTPKNMQCAHQNYIGGQLAIVGEDNQDPNEWDILKCCHSLSQSSANQVLCQADDNCESYQSYALVDNYYQEVDGWGNTHIWQYICKYEDYEFKGECKQPPGYIPNVGHEQECNNNNDDDSDGLKDCFDDDCKLSEFCCYDSDSTPSDINGDLWDPSYAISGYTLGWWTQWTNDWTGTIGEERFGVRTDFCSDKSQNWAKVNYCEGEDCYVRENSCSQLGEQTFTGTSSKACPEGCNGGICKSQNLPSVADCQDLSCVNSNKTGPNGAQCCLSDEDCSLGAVCGADNECHETICDKDVDNDKDNLTQCEDSDCNAKKCGGTPTWPKVCSNGLCKNLATPGSAPTETIITETIFSYNDILAILHDGTVFKEEGICDEVCESKSQTCIFADGGRKVCAEEGSTRCTCR